MSEDTKEIKLPSGRSVVIRNYTTNKDDSIGESVLYRGVGADNSGNFSFPISNVAEMTASYVRRLTVSVDGDSNRSTVESALDDMRSTDYEVLEKAVSEVVDASSPKAKGVLTTSNDLTKTK